MTRIESVRRSGDTKVVWQPKIFAGFQTCSNDIVIRHSGILDRCIGCRSTVKAYGGIKHSDIPVVHIILKRTAGPDTDEGVDTEPGKFFHADRDRRTSHARAHARNRHTFVDSGIGAVLPVIHYLVRFVPERRHHRYPSGIPGQKNIRGYIPFFQLNMILKRHSFLPPFSVISVF